MSQFRTCTRCGGKAARWRGVWCAACEEVTKDQALYALLDEDRSSISSLHEDITVAQAILKDDAANGLYVQILRRVTGQAGARAELNESRSSFDDMWDRMEAALDRSEFEAQTR